MSERTRSATSKNKKTKRKSARRITDYKQVYDRSSLIRYMKYLYVSKLKDDKTFKKFMKRLGENMKFMSGPDYEKIRAEKSNNYKSLVK